VPRTVAGCNYRWDIAAELAGLPSGLLHREYFGAKSVEQETGGAFQVEISSTGQVLDVPAHLNVAQVLGEAGIVLPLSCEQGICGSCLTGVLAGVPEHRDSILDDEQKARNDCFTPCCSRALSPRLVLAL
jgi:vanillate O-demethylase ferredoxin subunit